MIKEMPFEIISQSLNKAYSLNYSQNIATNLTFFGVRSFFAGFH